MTRSLDRDAIVDGFWKIGMCKVRTYVCVYKKDTMIIDEDRRFSITGRKSREDRAMLRGRIPAGGLADPMRHKST